MKGTRRPSRDRMRAMAAEAESELQAATAWMDDAQRAALRPEQMRQRGELMRLVADLGALPDPNAFLAAHRQYLPPRTAEQARQAHEWLGRFLASLAPKS